MIDFNAQFSMNGRDYLCGLDLPSLYRHHYVIHHLLDLGPEKVLEIGAGDGIVKHCARQFAKRYTVMDINKKLLPDVTSDLRYFRPELKENFDAVVCTEVLEHMPFDDLEKNLANIFRYLAPGGHAIISLPHRRGRVMIVSPFSYKKPWIFELPSWLKSSPRSFYEQVIKKNTWKDPSHCWEIDDRNVKAGDIEMIIKKVGFAIGDAEKILQADCWLLAKK